MSGPAQIERLKYWGRVLAGAAVHRAGGFRSLLPVFQPRPTGLGRRLQAYLVHYYQERETVEVDLRVPDLGVSFRCDLKDHMLEPWIHGRAPIYEFLEIDHARRMARPGDRIVDLGANHGFWGFSVARAAGTRARVVLVEANPLVASRLRRTMRLNADIDAVVVECALGNGRSKEARFYVPRKGMSGLGSLVLHDFAVGHGYLEHDRHVTVQATTLDDLVGDGAIDGMDLVKIDLEQAEDAFMEGARKAFARYRPRLVMCETSTASETFRSFLSFGYRAYVLDDAGVRRPIPSGLFWGNVFFES